MLGMTEAGSVCLASGDEGDQPEHRRGSFGRPVPGFEARIVDPETGAGGGVDQVGELWLRGPFLMEGYYGRERHETFTPDGWYRTGDLFRVDAEGFFYFCGRHVDMIKTAGANVSPREVEAAITDVTGMAAHVVGLDDPVRGQVVAAAVCATAGSGRAGDRGAAGRTEGPALRLQGAPAVPRAARRGRAHAVQRQARCRRPEGALR